MQIRVFQKRFSQIMVVLSLENIEWKPLIVLSTKDNHNECFNILFPSKYSVVCTHVYEAWLPDFFTYVALLKFIMLF